jgi:cytidyltransferase-like protein
MAQYLGKNCVYVGSFNPIHIGHINAIKNILEKFEYALIFVRYNEGVDLTDWDTKKMWFDKLNEELGGRLKIYKEVSEEKGKQYGLQLFFDFIRKTEQVAGEEVQGFYFGDDYQKILSDLEAEFPEKKFIIGARDGYSSTAIREDLEGHKDWLPEYVYYSVKESMNEDSGGK